MLPLTLSATVGEASSTLVYTYDAAGNITSVTDGENVTRYYYDNMGQLIREDNPYSQKTCVYAYDSCGNILSRTEYGYTDDENPTGGTATVYEYNNAAWGDQLTSWNGESITYDAIGNPLLYRGRSLTWTQGRRLAGINAEGLNVTYTYDESGTRTGKTVNGVSTQYYINGSQILAQKSGEDILYFLYDETGSAVGFKYNNNLYLYRKNLQGDILAVLNGQTGAVEASYTYDAWGKVISSTGALANLNPFRYRGYYYDSETGMYYLQSRYYDPETGRFINADSQLNDGILGLNIYIYCNNNPIMKSDPMGNVSISSLDEYYDNWLKQKSTILGAAMRTIVPGLYKKIKMAGTEATLATLRAANLNVSAAFFEYAMYGNGGKLPTKYSSLVSSALREYDPLYEEVYKVVANARAEGKTMVSQKYEMVIPISNTDLFCAVHKITVTISATRTAGGYEAYAHMGEYFDFTESWLLKPGGRMKAINDIGVALQYSGMLKPFYWSTSLQYRF